MTSFVFSRHPRSHADLDRVPLTTHLASRVSLVISPFDVPSGPGVRPLPLLSQESSSLCDSLRTLTSEMSYVTPRPTQTSFILIWFQKGSGVGLGNDFMSRVIGYTPTVFNGD